MKLTITLEVTVDPFRWADEYGIDDDPAIVAADIENYYDPAYIETALVPVHLQSLVTVNSARAKVTKGPGRDVRVQVQR